MSNKNSENEASSSSSSSGGRDRKSRKIPSQNLNLLDYDRIIHGFPPLLKKSRPLEKYHRGMMPILPKITLEDPAIVRQRQRDLVKKLSVEPIDIPTLVEERVEKLKNNAFLYLMHSLPPSDVNFDPYNLVIAPYSKVDKTGFYTISKKGVTFWSNKENHFTSLDEWYEEYKTYCSLRKIKIFKKFRLWKTFYVWMKSIKWKKFNNARNFLNENLFFANPILHSTLIEIREEFCELVNLKFTDIQILEQWHLFYFAENQMAQFETTRDKLLNFHQRMKSKLFDACYTAIQVKGYSPIDEIINCKSIKKVKEEISFTMRSAKKTFCSRLTKFLCLADLITINLLHAVLRNSFEDLAQLFQIHTDCGPSFEKLKEVTDTGIEVEDPRPPNAPQSPLLTAELVLKPDNVNVDPSRDVTTHILNQIIELFFAAIHNVKPFQNDESFKLFTEPSIVGHQEEKLFENAASIDFMINIDEELQHNRLSIIDNINTAYDKVELYIQRFEMIREAYKEDVQMDKELLRKEKDLDTLITYCERYTNEMNGLEGLLPTCYLGLLQLNQGTFKEEIIPTCRELLSILETLLPNLARETVLEVREKAENLMTKLTTHPIDAQSYVNFLNFLEKCPVKIEDIEKVIGYALKAFQIMKEFEINISEEEKENFLESEEFLEQLKTEFKSKIDGRQNIIDLLAENLQNDIKNIFDEVENVRIEILKPNLIDESSVSTEVRETLAELMEKLHECQEASIKIKKWQKDFRIDITRFDTLDIVFNEVRLRQMLWDSILQWKDSVEEWNETSFHKLNMQQIVELNTKILKNCGSLEKNLPKNNIVPKLKMECEEFKEKLPVLMCLRSPDIKARHWLKIEQILDRKLLGIENLTIYTFEEANAFDENISELIQEVSGQASGEARLEDSLKKIDNIWKTQELTIVTHRDTRDTYILAGIDELQAVLDDSNVTITTVAASRHIGTLKSRVEEWIRQLDLFAKTFEEWQSCQQSWIYLEAIFSAPDIQRQLPHEAKMFVVVDKSWKEIMRYVSKFPLAMPAMTQNGYYELFKKNNSLLDQITRCLEAYLEVKRVAFPRFYFLSNDELLEILAQTKNPHAVQPHLRKCFDAIAKIEFGTKEGEKRGEKVQTNDILAMLSPEGEKVQFNRGLKARGAVEDWLGKVEDAMFTALKRSMKYGYQTCKAMKRTNWIRDNPNQIVLTVSQQQWAEDVHSILDSHPDPSIVMKKLMEFAKQLNLNLTELAAMARSDLKPLTRKVLCALITIDVHAKDTINNLIDNNVTRSDDFNWLKMLRYYWRPETETMETKMASTKLPYFYEYLGAGGVLVITPLTDRCYLCLMGALQMDLGGAPAGPAGSGKTETTKDLAKALAVQCVVFNCSDGLDYKMMGRFFSGLAQSGAWCCFDEFNRIDIEVLSVIAQQLITIRNAKALRAKRFLFEGREIKLVQSCATFITMNPGYAGRTELPDNLKALFRPVSMMIPDYKLISTVILYSEGFEESKMLAQKMIHMYKLCSEQLSQQDHYDFGMRAVKSVLVMAGTLKRASPQQSEEITLICALRDSNLPKFLADDAILFNGILNDLFPGTELPKPQYGELQKAIEESMKAKNLQTVPALVTKVVQLYETMKVRWGVMLVGPAASGKTSTLHVLGDALTRLYQNGVENPNYRNVRIQTLNPKSVNADELYGSVNMSTLEWKDGLLGLAVRSAVSITEEEHQWIVADGPVDAVWIENLNTLLDDNKMLCLANSERIKLTPWVHMIFEVQDLAQASPATVSRCGMVYCDSMDLGWEAIVDSWLNTFDNDRFDDDLKKYIRNLFTQYFNEILKFARQRCAFMIHQVENSKIEMLCKMLKAIISSIPNANLMDSTDMKSYICKMWIWSNLWSIGSNFMEASRVILEKHLRKIINGLEFSELPEGNLYEYRVDPETRVWEKWEKIIPPFIYSPSMSFYDMLVPTSDSVRFGYVSDILFRAGQHVLFTGETGVGKSVIARQILTRLSEDNFMPVYINFSAQTSSIRTQEMIESRLEKRKRTLFGAPLGKKLIFFVDDVNMPKPEKYGAQPPIELLRQFLDFQGFYDRDKMFWKEIADVVLGAACAPPGGGRNSLPARFVRHFSLLSLPSPNTGTLVGIFGGIIVGFFSDFSKSIWSMAEPVVLAAVTMYERISVELLPTPQKSHYIFNLRDLSKCIQGILQADTTNYTNQLQILRLFYHESMRVFHDRLINNEDRDYFKQLLREISIKFFDGPVVGDDEMLMYGDFMIFGQPKENRAYEEIKDINKLRNLITDYLQDFNGSTGKEMSLILFEDCVLHILRIARLLRSERGNGLLVGLSGMGKQSISRLSSHINGYQCTQIELTRGYDQNSFRDDLRKIYTIAGVNDKPIVFLMNDSQILKEEFLEDINNILNSGDVPNLFEGDEYEKVILNTRNACVESNYRNQTRDGIYEFFIARVRLNLHVVLCMSPIGDNFRRRCRMFPSLVNCCTIDWYEKWPPEALYAVAMGSLNSIAEDEEQCENMAKICVKIHESVEDAADRYYKEMRRHYYTTPSSYLELLKQYHALLKKRIDDIVVKRDRIANGLSKILETNEVVAVMSEELRIIVPIIEKKSNEMKDTVAKLEKDSAQADAIKSVVAQDETEAKQKAIETQELADDASRDLEVVMPQLRTAQEALKLLNKNDINEIKVFQKPPKLVQTVMESVCILLGSKPDWNTAKQLMNDVNFLKRLQEYDANNISEFTIKKLRPFVESKDFQPAIVEKVSKTARSMCSWVIAMNRYAEVYKDIEPKIRKRDAAEQELRQVMAVLKYKQNQLAEVEAKIQALKDDLDVKQKEMQEVQDRYDVNSLRLARAGRLTAALSDEEVRWRETVAQLSEELIAVPGDVLVASACIAYLGAFSINYRHQMYSEWISECQRLKIPCSLHFDFVHCLGDSYQIRSWNVNGLPRDQISIENGIIVTQSNRWPLMIDPQEQANQWIRNMEKENNLVVMKMNDGNLIRSLEMAIRKGVPVLLEDLDETIEPSLQPLLAKSTRVQGGRILLKFGDNEIDYDPNFRLYMTTKLSNPHYLPEICIQVTIVNFLVSRSGLEDQLLADVVRIELPDMERQRNELIVSINSDKQQLIVLEDKILKLLFASKGNILDDEELVETLNESKDTAIVVASRLMDAEKTEEAITIEREKYRPLASRGAVLFFVVISLSEIDPMYQFSLRYFSKVFCNVIESEQQDLKLSFDDRIEYLITKEIYSIFQTVGRGLFERHKIIFSFLLAIALEKYDQNLTESQIDFILRGSIGTKNETKKPEELINITENQWINCLHLEHSFDNFKELTSHLNEEFIIKIGSFEAKFGGAKLSTKDWNTILTSFEKIMIISILKFESLTNAMNAYVTEILGRHFIESEIVPLSTIYQDTSSTTPLIFVLSTGSDPMGIVQKFAQEKEFAAKLHSISLGQGQGASAESLITKGRVNGFWIFLQNCHLATSWMNSLEGIVKNISLGEVKVHQDFRLFLSSMPSSNFPVSVLQNSVKLTNEPPKGLKANLTRSLNEIDQDHFEIHILGEQWKKLVFGICMFHGIILERRKFGSLGFNILYEFNESDRECALRTFDLFIDREKKRDIPWQALEYINGEITYGGRVTDALDQRCLKTILKSFSSERILHENYTYSENGIYHCPNGNLEEVKSFVSNLPFLEGPEVFGMHENANNVYQTKESKFFIQTILETQSKSSSISDNQNNDEIVLEMIETIKKSVVKFISIENVKDELMKLDEKGRPLPLTTVLFQEIEKFNKLLRVLHTTLTDLEKAIRGIIVMSEPLEEIYNSFLSNQVPSLWSKYGFLSTKSIANWIKDFILRIDQIESWINFGCPKSFWISGFFFPQGFLTGVLQTYARSKNVPIDLLNFDFEVLKNLPVQQKIYNTRKVDEYENHELYDNLELPEFGVNIHGIFIEAGKWDLDNGGLCDPEIGELSNPLPAVWLKPSLKVEIGDRYEAPLYKTPIRSGILSTTGHSTNFIISMLLNSKKSQEFWILRGTALVTLLTD